MAFDFDNDGLPVQSAGGGFDFDDDGAPVVSKPGLEAEGGGFAASAKQAVGAVIKGAGQAAGDFIPGVDQDNAVARYGQEVIDANPTAVRSLEDIKDQPWMAAKEATGNAAGSMAGMVGARALGMGITAAAPLTGPAAPVTALVGQAIAWFGPAAIAALPSYGSIREKQILNDPAAEQDAKAKAIATLGAATVGAIEVKFGPQEWALSAMTREGRKALAEKFAETTVAKAIGFGALKGAAIEGAEELVQNPVEQLASYDDPTTPENLQDTAFGGAMGAIGGGVLGGGTGAVVGANRNTAPMPGEPDVADIGAAQTVDEAILAADAVLAAPLEPAAGIADRLAPANPVLEGARSREDLQAFMESETRNLQVARAQILEDGRRERELDQIQQAGRQGLGRLPDQQVAAAEVATDETPTAMQLAMQRALARQAEKPDVSAPPAVQESPASPAAGWDFDAPAGLEADVGTGVSDVRTLDARGAADQPAGAAVPPGAAGPDIDALRTENAALRTQAIQALQPQQGPAAQAEPAPALRSDVPATGLPPAGTAALETGGVAADEVGRQLAGAGLELDDGVTPGKWSAKVGGLGDVMVDITSQPGEPVRATVRAQYMGKDYAQANAEGLPAILANVQKMRDGIQEFRQREAQKLAASRGLTANQDTGTRQVAMDAEPAKQEAVGVAQKDGTALIRGDVPKILDELKRQGFTAVLKRQGGVLVGRSQAQRALEVFKAPSEPKPVLALSPDDGRKLVALRNAGGKFQAVDDAGKIIPESPEFNTGPEADNWRRMRAAPQPEQPTPSAAEIDAKTDQIMRLFEEMGGGIALTRGQVRALIVEKGMEAAEKSVQAFQEKVRQDKATQAKLAKMKPARGTNEAVTNPKDVVGKSQSGRSADDISPGGRDEWARALQMAGAEVDGRVVRDHVPNRSSIEASITNPEILSGVRAVPLSAFDYTPGKPDQRTLDLAEQIRESGELNPLIVGIDAKGPYIIEGGHRLDALIHLGAKELPAVVVLDSDEFSNEPTAPKSGGVVKTTEKPISQMSAADLLRAAADKMEGKSETIQDLGEKIGGARKDTAQPTGRAPRKTAETDDRPAWARRFQISEIVRAGGQIGDVRDEGRWVIRDTRSLDWMKQPKQVGRETFVSREAAERALPLLAVAQKHRVVPVNVAGGEQAWEIWRDISDRKRVKVVDLQFGSRDDAMRYMAEHATEIIEANTTFGEADLPVPEDKRRVGAERRQGDVKGEDFRSAFGFRGVEFGNWNNQTERQELMNEAYDGLMDLADVMGIPPRAISLNGDLALAFGARGHGLSGARAHYEPDRAVMNLTKMKGAGALAHEWFHALDHYFGRQDGKAPVQWVTNKDGTRSLKTNSDFESNAVTSGFSRVNSGVREEVRQAYQTVMETMMRKAEKYVQDTARVEQFVATVRDGVESRLANIRRDLAEQKDVRYYKRNNKPATAEQLAAFDDIARQIIEGTALETELRPSGTKTLTGMRWSNDHLEKLSAIYKAVRGRSGFDAEQNGVLDRLRQEMGLYSARLKMLAEAQTGEEKTKKVPTDFAMDAKSLDQGRGTDYWITPHEMAARAFQGYVEDKIAERGGKSPFLNYGPENAGILTPWGAKRPYPAGAERKAINAAFDKLVDVIETRETEQGVAMFSEGQLPAVITPSTVERVQAAITELLGGKQLPNSLGRIVATTAAEIKSTWEPLIGKNVQIGSEGEAGIAQAFFDPRTKTVFLIADHINEGTETAVLAHELMHKHGQAVLGEAGWDRLHSLIGTWKDAPEDSDERFVYDYASRKVEAVGQELSTQELFPYAVEAAIKIGVKPSMQASRGTAARWLESVRQNLKMVWAKITGKPETFKAQDLVDLAFGIAQMENPESAQALRGALDETRAEQNALRALSENDELFALPKSDKTTVEEIAAENDPDIKVRQTKIGGETLYTLTMPGGETAKLWVREPSPYGEKIYSMELVDGDRSNVEIGRPGENPEDVDPATEDVYLDVSNLKPGQSGYTAYNIAATFAHNTGRIFIGDPSGLSDKAMRRRLENMISTALKFGTTDHIAPHPKQVRGDAKIGVPPLKWVYGDSLGNIRRMIDVSLKAEENSGNPPKIYDPRTGNFSEESARLPVEAPGGRLEQVAGPATGGLQRVQSETELGRRTRARAAIFRALLREEGEGGSGAQRGRDGILAGLVRVADQFPDSTRKIFYSRRVIVGETTRKHTPAQLRAMRNVGFEIEVPTLKERAQALWQDAGKKLAQGIVDQFAPVKDLDREAYGLLRLAKGASGAFEVFLHGGKLKLTDGVYDFDDQNKGGVIERLLLPLQGEHHDFFRWIAANRAERLTAEGRENLFTAQDIADLKTLADGTTDFDYTIQTGPRAGTVTRDRTLIYADSQRVFNEFNKNVLDLAEQSGLIDGASRHLWENEFYVPFYRVADEDGGVRGANIKSGVVRQEAFKKLKGGTQELNADLLDNTLMNWAHLLDAAAKNRAAKATIEAAEKLGAATRVAEGTKKSVWFMDKGEKHHAVVDDPYLLTAITSLEYAGMRNPVMNAMGAFKHYLTIGVTASPFFKVRNLIRDSMQVVATSGINPNPLANVGKGWALTNPQSDEYFRLMAGGGTIHFGTMLEGSEAKRVQALVESGVDDATLLDSEHKVKAFYRQFIEPAITAYNELGNRGEAINRASLYDQLRKQGVSHAEASLQARDLMDFSMQGSFTTIRFLTQVVPFFNARLQGMYKLGRAAKEDPKRMAAVIGAASLMSLALLAAYGDDDDWKKREEWDRNNYWWFKFGGMAFRIPKPFEIGAMATLAERGFELLFEDEMTGKRFRKQVLTLLADNLSMNPVPQLVKPILDVYANKDSFTGRPIETMGMDRLEAEYRFTNRTSMTARAASTAANAVTGLVGIESPSPVQIDHMLRGYFGWLGAFVVGFADTIMLRPMTGQPERASPDLWKVATGGMVGDVDSASSRYVSQMYEQAKEIERAYATWRNLVKEGKTLEAGEYLEENRDEIRRYRSVSAIKAQETRLNQRIRMIERSSMDAGKKRDQIKRLQEQKDRIARQLAK